MAKQIFSRVSVIGLGGIWSYFWKAACRTITFTKNAPHSVSLVDGDQFSFSNLERQDMTEEDEAKMKAYVYKERIDRGFPRLKATMVPEFVTKKNIGKIIQPNTIVPFLVDNHKTRKLVSEYVRENARKLKNVAVITAANDEFTANAHLHLVLGGKEITSAMDKCHPEIDKPADKNPGDLTCEERARLPGGGQTSNANMWAASLAHNYLWELLKGGNSNPKSIDPRIIAKSESFFDSRHLLVDTTSRAL
jgi:molybdopterin/thiamine biosynthesis adenylyltransferase